MAVKRYFPLVRTVPCPNCGAASGKETMVTGVYHCSQCKGYFGKCYRGEALTLVDLDAPIVKGSDLRRDADLRFYHFTWVDTGAVETGWFDRVTQRRVEG